MIGASFGPAHRADHTAETKGIATMLWTILVILLALWLIGLVASIGGALIHLLLVLALIVFVAQILTGRRSV
jgi:hypothetical protein